MKSLRRGYVVLVAVVLSGARPGSLLAQWGVTLEVQRASFGGTSLDTSTGGTGGSFRPGGTPIFGLRLDRRLGRVALGLGLRYARSAVVLDTRDLFIGYHDDFAAIEVAPEIRVRVARTPAAASLHVYGGPVIGVWTFSDQGARPVAGGIVGVAGEFPLLRRLALWVRVGGGLTRSVFRPAELPPEFVRRVTRRSEIALGLRYGR